MRTWNDSIWVGMLVILRGQETPARVARTKPIGDPSLNCDKHIGCPHFQLLGDTTWYSRLHIQPDDTAALQSIGQSCPWLPRPTAPAKAHQAELL